jgi:DNA invertase Pin-like site-specific DNA recombinase
MRCAVYTRKSSEEGLEQGFNSLDAQREACEAYVLSQAGEGWKVIATTYDDGGFSGGNIQRPAMQKLLAEIDQGLIDIVVVYKVDRLTRSLSDFSKIVDRFDAKSVSFVSVTQAFNTTSSMGRLTLNMLLSFAQFEREVTGERIRDKIAASKAKGMWMGGRPPLGYDGVDHRLKINEPEAEVVRAIFARYLELRSVVKLTRELAETSVRSKTWIGKDGAPRGGGMLGRGAIYHLLANPVYRGAIRHGEKLYPDAHPAIVEKSLWDAVQALLATNDLVKPASLKAGAGAMLKGVLWDDAGNAMQPSHTRRHDRRYHYYVTASLVHGDRSEPGSLPRIAAHVLDALVIKSVKTYLRPATGQGDSLETRVRGALRKVVLGASVVRLELAKEACRIDAINGVAPEIPYVEVIIPISLKHRQRATLIQPEARAPTLQRSLDRILIRAVCITREWRKRLETGDVASTRNLAIAEGLCNRHTGRLLPLAYLAPDLVELIIEGRQPRSMTLQVLTERPLPRTWDEQRALVASFA